MIKKSLNKLILLSLLLLGGLTVGQMWKNQLWSGNRVLGQMTNNEKIKVVKIVQDENQAAIILPKESVKQSTEGAFVLTVENNQVQKKVVQAQEWREKYYRIVDGLGNNDLVILESQVSPTQIVDYVVKNPEAGQSGVIEI